MWRWFAALCALAATADACAVGLVSRSCAPFGAQESISVDWHFRPHTLWTSSAHYRNGIFLHTATADWQSTWRSYAGHLGMEFWYGRVIGTHYEMRNGIVLFLGTSIASDCNVGQWGWAWLPQSRSR